MEAMSENIFERLESDWHAGERHAGDWFHRHAHRNSPMPANGDTISPGEAQAPPLSGDIVSLETIANDIKTAVETAEVNVRTVLDQHMPGLIELAQKVANDPLIQAAEAAALPPGAKQLVAEFITKLAATFPPAPAEAEPAPEPQAA